MPKKLISIRSFSPAAAVRVTGEDAVDFLQGQFTNDLRSPVGSVTYGLWLNQKGKVLADSEILRISDRDFLVMSVYSAASVIIQRLEQYIIADDVVLDDQTPATRVLQVGGEGSADFIRDTAGATPKSGCFLEGGGVRIFNDAKAGGVGFKLAGPVDVIQELRTAILAPGGTEVTEHDAEVARIAAGIPRIPGDLGSTDLPQEAGLETTAISFTKGCYLGQEVMARLKSMGQVRRRLRRIRGTGAVPVSGASLFQGEKRVGEVRSAVATPEGFVALAMLTQMGLDENAGFSFDPASGVRLVASLWTK